MTSATAAATTEEARRLDVLAHYALRYVKPGATLGLGTGHAATAFIKALGANGPKVRAVPTSNASADLARGLGIEIVALSATSTIDITFDGADEVDPRLNLIKGFGGALVREKIVAAASRRRIMLVGEEKLVKRLGSRGRLPVEVVPFAVPFCSREIKKLGLRPEVRTGKGGRQFISDNGNLILDCKLRQIPAPARLERLLRAIPGIVGTGLFVAMADVVLIAAADGEIRVRKRSRGG